MKKGILVLGLIAVLAGAAFAQSSDVAAIRAVWDEYTRAVVAGDGESFLNLHDRTAYKMPQNQPMFQLWKNPETFKSSFAESARQNTVVMRIDPMETVVFGSYAYSMGTYYLSETPKAGGDSSVIDGKFLTVLHKDASGNWKILRDCYNNNTPSD